MLYPDNAAAVSVITIVKDGASYLGQALTSILAQSWPPGEILVVDGQSSDDTAAIARSFSPAVGYLLQTDQEIANARNLGLQAARGEWVAFLDHDDLWPVDKLEAQLAFMLSQPELQYTTTLMQLVQDGSVTQSRPGCTPSALLARRQVFETVGLFDPRFRIGCDAEWITRARDLGIASAVVPKVLLQKRLHATNLSRNGALNRQEMMRIAKESIARRR